jgi:chaperonin GroEL
MTPEAQEILFEDAARAKLLSGINKLADAVAFTLGPKGRNAGLESSYGSPQITNDGDTIVQSIVLEDVFENLGVSMAKEAAAKMKERAGDGTTSVMILLRALVQSGLKYVAAGGNPMDLKRGIDQATETVIKQIEASSTPVQSDEDTLNIATAASSGNREIGQIISQALALVNRTGIVTLEDSNGIDTTVELVEGMQLDRGYASPYFCSSQGQTTLELSNPLILLVNKRISSVTELLPILQPVAQLGHELLIIAEDIEGEALATLVINRMRGMLKAVAIKSPGFGDRAKELMQDIAVATGATLISDELGISLKDATPQVLGRAEKIIVTNNSTTIIKGDGNPEEIENRIKLLENEIKDCKETHQASRLRERKGKLKDGVAIIRVGGATETEQKQRKQLFQDSLNSTRAAIEEGIVTGGGVALLHASKAISEASSSDSDLAHGKQIVKKACEATLRQIALNAGEDPALIVGAALASKEKNFGYNMTSGKLENLVQAGVIDPAKVVKNALLTASSVAGIIILSEAIIAPSEG